MTCSEKGTPMKMLDRWLSLAVDWEFGMRLTGWLLSEKMNGCRCLWDTQNLWTRGGRRIELPPAIRATLPTDLRLDGELWAGRQGFRTACNAAMLGRWAPACEFVAFDAPTVQGPWPERLAVARAHYGKVVEFKPFISVRETNGWLADLWAVGGEGLVARDPTAPYVIGRTKTVVKVKGHIP